VIAMPFCLVGLAPPAFTAPCRNQTNEPAALKGKRYAGWFIRKTGGSVGLASGGLTTLATILRICRSHAGYENKPGERKDRKDRKAESPGFLSLRA
jgi:hypothetical protein